MPSLPKLIPDVDHLLSMEPEELATYVLVAASDQRQNNIVAMSSFISGLVSTSAHPGAYTDQRRDEIGLAITEAWNWLEVQGLLIPAPGINGASGFRMLSRRTCWLAVHNMWARCYIRGIFTPTRGDVHVTAHRHSGMVREHQTRNLEIPGSMLRIAPE